MYHHAMLLAPLKIRPPLVLGARAARLGSAFHAGLGVRAVGGAPPRWTLLGIQKVLFGVLSQTPQSSQGRGASEAGN